MLMPEHLDPAITAGRRTVPTERHEAGPSEVVVRLDQPHAARSSTGPLSERSDGQVRVSTQTTQHSHPHSVHNRGHFGSCVMK